MEINLVTQIMITAIVVPLISGFNLLLDSRRIKRARFDEIRLSAFSAFAQGVAEVLWASNSGEAVARKAKMWISYETILLTANAEVIDSARICRETITKWVESMREAERQGMTFGLKSQGTPDEAERLAMFYNTNSINVYKALNDFQILARSNMGLPKLDTQFVKGIYKYYEDEAKTELAQQHHVTPTKPN